MSTLAPPMAGAAGGAYAGDAAAPVHPRRAMAGVGGHWVLAFVLVQLLCQVALLSGWVGELRVFVRLAAFAVSLLLLLALRGRGTPHPAALPALVVALLVSVLTFHPETAGLPAGAAQAGLYVAVLAPVFWVTRLRLDMSVLRRTVMLLWAFHSLGAALGVAQVAVPGSLQPALSTVVTSKGPGYVESLKITTASGEKVFRPMGLTDVPGGAAIHGLYAVLFGIGFFLTRRSPLMLGATLTSMVLGIMCLYLSQVRSVLVMTAVSVVVLCAILAWRRELGRLLALGICVGVVGVVGMMAARDMAGPAVMQRIHTLVQQPAARVYYDNRGHFLETAVMEQLPRAPLGEGLGHWGMTASYFGDYSTNAKPIWVEIQWAAWIVDGGVPLTLGYALIVLMALLFAWRVARRPAPSREASDLPFWGGVVLAYGVGALALTFSYPIFLSQTGMEFWLLNALLFACARDAVPQAVAFSDPGEVAPAAA